MYDVLIIGGSYAGASAAIQLGRARRKVLVVDAGVRRNRFASHAHGFLGADGMDPAELAAKARAEVTAYPTVTWREDFVEWARKTEDGFAIKLASGEAQRGKAVILALGVTDELPDIPGVTERWGKTIFACPYCHGYELDKGRLAALATGPMSVHHGVMLPDWGPTTYFTNGQFEPTPDELAQMQKRGTVVNRKPVTSVSGGGSGITLHLAGGEEAPFAGLFLMPKIKLGPLAEQLGCELDAGPFGSLVKTDPMMKATTVPGVFACGDDANMAASIALAVADGVRAGTAAHRTLLLG